MVDRGDWHEEIARLAFVVKLVSDRLEETRSVVREQTGSAREQRRSMWEDAPRQVTSTEEWSELAQITTALRQQERNLAFYKQQVQRLERMLGAPYFGRIDFRESGTEQAERIYVGIGALHDPATGELEVFDWRAPVCSLFYDAELGPAQYECHDGVIAGDVTLKRQFRITDAHLEFMFDTDLKIDDEMLQELLGRQTDEKMRSIVTSIQREQNRVIRDQDHGLLLVQGPAGSGKTAIALHRAAYLLYKHRDSLSAKDIVIFSPNRVFSDYISAVLPELGEENVQQTTMHEYALQELEPRFRVEGVYSQLEYLLAPRLGHGSSVREEAICYKASPHFLNVLRNYVRFLESGGATTFWDVVHAEKVVMSKEEMKRLYTVSYRDLALAKRLEKIRQRVLYLLEPLEEARRLEWREILTSGPDRMFAWEIKSESLRRTKEEFAPLKARLTAWASCDYSRAYRRLFKDAALSRELAGGQDPPAEWARICRQTLAALADNRLPYEDVAPMLYLKRAVEGAPILHSVRHVIVDEGQDYTPLQYEVLGMIFPRCSLTVLGDLHQTVHPYMHASNHTEITEALRREDSTFVCLTKSYRSTQQIMEFARHLLTEPDEVEVVRRNGPKPLMTFVPSEEELNETLVHDLEGLRARGYGSIAVLCKTNAEARWVHHQLQDRLPIHLLTAEAEHFRKGLLVLPAYLAKGLEFDAVVIYDAGANKYREEEERGLLYTACTRALHELHVYYTDELTPLLRDLDSQLFTTESG